MSASEDRNVDQWLATGDIGELDSEGRLSIRGRKKEMIVLPDGRKVFPEDVETVLLVIPGVRDCAVIGPDQVHAVLVTEPGVDAETIVARANEKLEDQQKIRAVSTWPPGEELPRTTGTGKLKRARNAAADPRRERTAAPSSGDGKRPISQRYAPGRTITPETTLDELGLSSLDRVQISDRAGAAARHRDRRGIDGSQDGGGFGEAATGVGARDGSAYGVPPVGAVMVGAGDSNGGAVYSGSAVDAVLRTNYGRGRGKPGRP